MSPKKIQKPLDIVLYPLPSNWEWGTVSDAGANQKNAIVDGPFGSNLKVSDYVENGPVPVLTTKNLEGNYDKVRYISQDKFEELKRSAVYPGDILMAKIGSCGKTGIYPTGKPPAMIPANLLKVTLNEHFELKYLYYYFDTKYFQDALRKITKATAQPAFGVTNFRRLPLPIAPLEQQKRIVAEIEKQFSRLDEAVANLKRVKANLKRYKAAVLKAAVEGKLTEEWRAAHGCANVAGGRTPGATKQHLDVEPASKLLERILAERRQKWEEAEFAKMKANGKVPKDDKWKGKYKETESLGDVDFTIPQSWAVATVQQLAERVQYGSSSKTNEDESGIPVLRMGNIFEGELALEKLKYLPSKHTEFPELLLDEDDLLFNRTNSPELVGKTAVYKGKPAPCSFASYLIRVRMMKGVEAKFVSYYINSMHGRQWVKSVVTQQVGQANVNGTKLQALILSVPPAEEQKAIVVEMEKRLSLMNGMEAAVETNLLRADRLRQSILSKAFSGQLVSVRLEV